MTKFAQHLTAAKQGKTLKEVATKEWYCSTRTAQRDFDKYGCRISFAEIRILYRLAETLSNILKHNMSVSDAYRLAGGESTKDYYTYMRKYRLKDDLKKQKLFIQSMSLIDKIAEASSKNPVKLSSLKCNRDNILFLRKLHFPIISKPGKYNAGYFFTANESERIQSRTWNEKWRKSVGLDENSALTELITQ